MEDPLLQLRDFSPYYMKVRAIRIKNNPNFRLIIKVGYQDRRFPWYKDHPIRYHEISKFKFLCTPASPEARRFIWNCFCPMDGYWEFLLRDVLSEYIKRTSEAVGTFLFNANIIAAALHIFSGHASVHAFGKAFAKAFYDVKMISPDIQTVQENIMLEARHELCKLGVRLNFFHDERHAYLHVMNALLPENQIRVLLAQRGISFDDPRYGFLHVKQYLFPENQLTLVTTADILRENRRVYGKSYNN